MPPTEDVTSVQHGMLRIVYNTTCVKTCPAVFFEFGGRWFLSTWCRVRLHPCWWPTSPHLRWWTLTLQGFSCQFGGAVVRFGGGIAAFLAFPPMLDVNYCSLEKTYVNSKELRCFLSCLCGFWFRHAIICKNRSRCFTIFSKRHPMSGHQNT